MWGSDHMGKNYSRAIVVNLCGLVPTPPPPPSPSMWDLGGGLGVVVLDGFGVQGVRGFRDWA